MMTNAQPLAQLHASGRAKSDLTGQVMLHRFLALLLAVVVAGISGCGRDTASQPRLIGQARLSFQGLPDGPAPQFFGGGEASLRTNPPGDPGGELRIMGGKLTNEPTIGGGAASYYTSASLGGPITTIGARWTFTRQGGTPGAMALLVSQKALYPPFSVHLVITPNSWGFGVWPPDVWPPDGGPISGLQNLVWERLEEPLEQDGVHVYETQVEIDGERANIELPDGQQRVIRDNRIADWAGSFATFEAYSDHALTDSRVGFTEIWAESRNTVIP
jgi:hypothetical protein